MTALAAFVLVGLVGLSLGRPLDDDPRNRCQGKKRGETPAGFTKETFNEKETECIYFCRPPALNGQWFFGIILDGTECKSPAGEQGKCASGVCIIDGKEVPVKLEGPNEVESPAAMASHAIPEDGENTEPTTAPLVTEPSENAPAALPGEDTPPEEDAAPGSPTDEEDSTLGETDDDTDI